MILVLLQKCITFYSVVSHGLADFSRLFYILYFLSTDIHIHRDKMDKSNSSLVERISIHHSILFCTTQRGTERDVEIYEQTNV